MPKDSLTPTFAVAALFTNKAKWDEVPFLMKTGKALDTKGLRQGYSLGMCLETYITECGSCSGLKVHENPWAWLAVIIGGVLENVV